MSLPVDPTTIDAGDIGAETATLELDHEEAIEYVRGICENEGFGIAMEFSPSELLNEKVDAGRDPYFVLGACNPEVADRALDASEKRIGALFPCNMVIWEEEPGRQLVYHVSIMRIARLVNLAPDDDTWADIIADTGEMVDSVFTTLQNSEHAVA